MTSEISRHYYSNTLTNNHRRRNLDNEGVFWSRDTLTTYLCSYSFTIHDFHKAVFVLCIYNSTLYDENDYVVRLQNKNRSQSYFLSCCYNPLSSKRFKNSFLERSEYIYSSKNLIYDNNANSYKTILF